VRAFRARALGAGLAAGGAAIGGLFVLRDDARPLYEGLTSGEGLVFVVLSGVAGVLTLGLVWRERFGPARISAASAVACVTVGWAFAQSPYLLPGRLTLEDAAASDATLVALLGSVAVGLLVLVPALVVLYRLVLRGRLDQEFEPLDQRFRPLTAGDRPREP
jgi:cytochrome d ubiquinol oxidase subunit II